MYYEQAKASDMEQLISMRIAFIKDYQGNVTEEDEKAMRQNLPNYFLEHLEKDLFAFVAKENENIVSTVLLLVMEKPSNPNFINGKIGNVLNVYTKPEYRHQGIAEKLIEDMILFSKDLQLDYLELLATGEGYPLYKKIGFHEHTSSCIEMRYDFQRNCKK